MHKISFLMGCGLLLLPLGCHKNDDDVQTYRVTKDSSAPTMPMGGAPMMGSNAGAPPSANPPPMMGNAGTPPQGSDMQSMGASMGMRAAGSSSDVDWKVPSGWDVQPPSPMRVGSFHYKASNGYVADISVVPLAGDAGGDLANINRWRGQINLPPITEADLPHATENITAGGHTMRLVDMVSTDLEVDNKSPKRLIAVTYPQGSRSWFFKMMGEDKAVEEAKPAFLRFIKSLRFHDNS